MVHYSTDPLDVRFAALADATRRGVLVAIGRGDVSISDLAERFDMTLTGMKKHVDVLERAGLVATRKIGRVRVCRPGAAGLDDVADWIGRYHALWATRFDALDRVIETLKREDRQDG